MTQKQWENVMGKNPSAFKGEDLPVESVSWNDVQDFINKLNERSGGDIACPQKRNGILLSCLDTTAFFGMASVEVPIS